MSHKETVHWAGIQRHFSCNTRMHLEIQQQFIISQICHFLLFLSHWILLHSFTKYRCFLNVTFVARKQELVSWSSYDAEILQNQVPSEKLMHRLLNEILWCNMIYHNHKLLLLYHEFLAFWKECYRLTKPCNIKWH